MVGLADGIVRLAAQLVGLPDGIVRLAARMVGWFS